MFCRKNMFSKLLSRLVKFIIPLISIISPKVSVKILYRLCFKRNLNLKNPQTLNEKIQWLKLNLYNNDPLVKICADKYTVREYIKSKGCGSILNDIYGVYNNVNEIPWDKLPDKFVLKWNFCNGFNIICQDKKLLNITKVSKQLRVWGKSNKHLLYSEFQYRIKKERKIICEQFIEPTEGHSSLEDYKIYCFNGVAEYVMVCYGRESGDPKFYYFDRNWTLMKFSVDALNISDDFCFPKPKGLDEMFYYANKISKPFPFVRADFYLQNGNVIFGELTFTPSGGFDTKRIYETDLHLGQKLILPNII